MLMGSPTNPVTILIVDDHPLLRYGLRKLLEPEAEFCVVGEASDGAGALELARTLRPDIVLLDLALPGGSGLDVLGDLAALESQPRTVILTASVDRADMARAFQLGARGIILKESATDVLIESIRGVVKGQFWVGRESVSDLVQLLRAYLPRDAGENRRENFGLSGRELQVVTEVVAGYGNREIARRLSLSEQTVKHHITNIFDKLGVSNRLELTLFAINHHLVDSV
jgi:two-component system, NarL family, nitrate/nitrite response regulator NarL